MLTPVQLSVIIPFYNAERYLKKCLDSIAKQKTNGQMEVLCIDDGSDDRSYEIASSFVKNDSRFQLIKQSNQGRSVARNKGLELAKGEFITFVDADDIVGTSKLVTGNEFQIMLEQAKEGIDLVVGGIEVVHEVNHQKALNDKKYYAPAFSGLFYLTTENILRVNCSSCAKLFKKQVINKYGLRYPDGLNYEDAFWWFSYASCIQQAYYVTDTVYTYFRHDSGIMNQTFQEKNTELALQHVLIIEKFFQFLKRTGKVQTYNELTLRLFELYLISALQYCATEDSLYVLWRTGQILRENDVDVKGNLFLMSLKKGQMENFSFDPSILRDAYRWRKILKIFNRLCPNNSLRRRLVTSFASMFVVLIRKI